MPQGIVPVALRAFPTNAAALAVWEAVMRGMGAKEVSVTASSGSRANIADICLIYSNAIQLMLQLTD